MRAVIQRVGSGSVSVGGKTISEIKQGLVILLGIGPEDNEEKAAAMARKIARMRIFGDDQGKINLSVLDIDLLLKPMPSVLSRLGIVYPSG